MKRSLCVCVCMMALLVTAGISPSAEKQKSTQLVFPFDILDGAVNATSSVLSLPVQALSSYHPVGVGTKGRDPYGRYTRYGYKTDIQREYLQLNWYDDARRGYSELHEWKEADEELYQMLRR